MEFLELEQRDRNHINGRLSSFMDRYIRQNKVWTPEQMFLTFFEIIEDNIKRKNFNRDFFDDKIIWDAEQATLWLNTKVGRDFALEKFQTKYLKDKPIADKKSPLVERVRFGLSWNDKFYDIGFGLKDRYNFIKTEELKNLTVEPWTIKHVNKELKEKYNINLLHCLNDLSTSHLEKVFYRKWVNQYYKDDNPAIIPEVCGLRSKFYYFELGEDILTYRKSIDYKAINFRYDFLLINFRKQRVAFIELDGFEYHKSRKNQTVDSIKRNMAAKYNISLMSFTSKQILQDIDTVFDELKDYLT